MKLTTTLLAVAAATFLLVGSNAHAVLPGITLNLTFDTSNLAAGTDRAGTFTLSGGATSTAGASGAWTTSSGGAGTPGALMPDEGFLVLKVLSLDTPPSVTYNGSSFTVGGMVGNSLLNIENDSGGQNSLTIYGSSTLSPSGAAFLIGNGSSDFISGTFSIQYSDGLGSFTVDDLNGTFGSSSGTFARNVTVVASTVSAVPEPSTYAVVAGLAILGFSGGRRWRGRRSSLAREPKVILLDA